MSNPYIVRLAGQEDWYGEANASICRGDTQYQLQDLAQRAVRDWGILSPRKNPVKVKVQIFAVDFKKGRPVERLASTLEVQPTLERMTDEEYNAEMAEILDPLPEEFRPFISSRAYEEGHSAGYEEVVSIARSLVHELQPCIDKYERRMR